MIKTLIKTILVILLLVSVCSADDAVGGIPLTTIQEGTVNGGIYYDSLYGIFGQEGQGSGGISLTIDKTFTIPSHTDIEWAMLFTSVYCGNMEVNKPGWANVTFDDVVLGNESLDVSFDFKVNGGEGYVIVNDHVNRVTSDYMMWYDVTDLIHEGDITAVVHTENQSSSTFDGRITLISLIVAYNDDSDNSIHYWINLGHDVDCYYMEDWGLGDYIGSSDFSASFSPDITLHSAELTVIHRSSIDGSYIFNGNDIASGTPQGDYSGSNTWDVTGNFIPDGTNTLTYDRIGGFYKIPLAILTVESQESSSESEIEISGISVKHNYYNGAWKDLVNTVNVTVANNGTTDAASFNVMLYADDIEVDTLSVPSLAAGASTVVSFDWTPAEAKTYTLKAVAENAELTKSQDVKYNGYIGDKPLITYAHDTITGDILYTYGNSSYSGELCSGDTYTVNHEITLPSGASVVFARLYNYWTWSYVGTTIKTGQYPNMALSFEGSELSPDAQYDDKKGWGSQYDFPAGTWAYDVTDQVTGTGTYTTVVTNTDTGEGIFCMDGLSLLVVYEDSNGQQIEYWINEGADMISTMITSGGLMPEEATTTSTFQGSVDLSNVESARLWTVVQSGDHLENTLTFNAGEWTGVYDATPYADLDIDEARDVIDHLIAGDNTAKISAALYPEGDYLMPSSAILVLTYTGVPGPKLSISANPTIVTVGTPTDVTFTVTNGTTPVEGADITLTGSATGNGTTNSTGTAVISVNATSEGTITATATKEGYTSATTTLTAEEEGEGVSSSVSLSVEIKPAISLEITPNSIDFGDLSPGETSNAQTLTLKNKGGYDFTVTAQVSDNPTEDTLFKNGLLLNSSAWSEYTAPIAAQASDTADASLNVPDDYTGIGQKQGDIVFWAEA